MRNAIRYPLSLNLHNAAEAGLFPTTCEIKARRCRHGRLLGAHILAPECADGIQAAALAIRQGLTNDDLAITIFPHLTTVKGPSLLRWLSIKMPPSYLVAPAEFLSGLTALMWPTSDGTF